MKLSTKIILGIAIAAVIFFGLETLIAGHFMTQFSGNH